MTYKSIRFLAVGLSLLALTGTMQSTMSAAQRTQGDVLRLRTVQIMDPHGFGQPVPAQSLLVPADWRTQGEMRWKFSQCLSDIIEERFLASSPDGQVAFEILPSYFWQWGNDQVTQTGIQMSGCRLAKPLNAVGVLQHYVIPRFRPGARIRNIRPSPEAARAAHEEYYRLQGPFLQMQNAALRTDAISAIIEYRHQGHAYEEWVTLNLAEIVVPFVSGPYHSYKANHIYAFRAPKGQLSNYEKLFATMMASVHINPAWQHALIQVVANVGTMTSREAGKRAAIWQNSVNQIGEMRVQTWQRNQETLSGVSRAWSRAFRGVDGYIDPRTQETFELPAGYQGAWRSGRGEYVLSTNPGFNPHERFPQRNWSRLQPAQQ